MRKINHINGPSKGRNLKILLPQVCNYRCSYCFQKKLDGPYDPDFFTHEKMDIIGAIIKLIGVERLTLIGGEPTLFDLFPLIRYITNYPIREIFITTNFSRPNDYFLRMQQVAKDSGTTIKLCCSLHDEFVDYTEFVEKTNDLFDKGQHHVAIEYVVSRNNKDNCIQIIDYIKSHLHKGIFLLIDCDVLDEEMKKFYKEQHLHHAIYAEGIDFNVFYEDGEQESFPRQALRLREISGEKYCVTDLVLSESNTLRSCYRELGTADTLLTLGTLSIDEKIFKCNQKFCRFCDNPHIFFDKNDFINYLNNKH